MDRHDRPKRPHRVLTLNQKYIVSRAHGARTGCIGRHIRGKGEIRVCGIRAVIGARDLRVTFMAVKVFPEESAETEHVTGPVPSALI
jgi:hypothetical protein